MSRCGPLDVADVRGYLETGSVPAADLARARAAALAAPEFDGDRDQHAGPVILGDRTVIKLQQRWHERLEALLRLEDLRARSVVPAPAIRRTGTVHGADGEVWWVVMDRAGGVTGALPTPARQRAVGAALRAWHELAAPGGLRLDAPGALGVLLGTPRFLVPDAYLVLAEHFDRACTGQPMTAIHGDAAVGHNVLFAGEELTAIIDPGGVDAGPPMLDLAWALAVDLPRGVDVGPLLDGYGRDGVDEAGLNELLPLMMARRLVDTAVLGTVGSDGAWLADRLRDTAPDLLAVLGPELAALTGVPLAAHR